MDIDLSGWGRGAMRVNCWSACVTTSLIALAACDGSKAGPVIRTERIRHAYNQTTPVTGPSRYSASNNFDALNRQLSASAVLFETITEQAQSQHTDSLHDLIEDAAKSVNAVMPLLPSQVGRNLASYIRLMRAASQAGSRSDVAFASTEAYRTLIVATPGTPVIPIDISLMNYAGLRYRTAAETDPSRWDDMDRAAAFARQHWTMLELRGVPSDIARQVGEVLDDMETATRNHDRELAIDAGRRELAMVDRLESAVGR